MFSLRPKIYNVNDGFNFGTAATEGFIPDAAAFAPGGQQQPNQQQGDQQNGGDQNKGDGNQSGDDKVKTLNPWQPSATIDANSGGDGNAQNSGQQQQGQNQGQQQQSPAGSLDKYVEGLNLTAGIDLGNLQQELQEGKFDSLDGAFATVAANTFKAAMLNSHTLIKKAVDQAVKEATASATDTTTRNFALRSLNAALPFTGKPEYAPIAERVLDGFMEQHRGDVDAAVNAAKDYFKQAAGEMAGQFKLTQPVSDGFGGTPPFQNNTNTQGQGGNEEPNWLEMLTAGGN